MMRCRRVAALSLAAWLAVGCVSCSGERSDRLSVDDIPENMRPGPAQPILVAPDGLGAQGAPCARDAECHSGVCWRGLCGESAPVTNGGGPGITGGACARDADCRSGFCDLGKCAELFGFAISANVRSCSGRCTTVSSAAPSLLVLLRGAAVLTFVWRDGAAPVNRTRSVRIRGVHRRALSSRTGLANSAEGSWRGFLPRRRRSLLRRRRGHLDPDPHGSGQWSERPHLGARWQTLPAPRHSLLAKV
jgi:hypothetical protein